MPPSRVALRLASDLVCATEKPHEEVTRPALPATRDPAVCPDSTVIGRCNMRSIVDQNGKIACQHEQIDRTLAWLPNAAS
jgi:hypothetical protein